MLPSRERLTEFAFQMCLPDHSEYIYFFLFLLLFLLLLLVFFFTYNTNNYYDTNKLYITYNTIPNY